MGGPHIPLARTALFANGMVWFGLSLLLFAIAGEQTYAAFTGRWFNVLGWFLRRRCGRAGRARCDREPEHSRGEEVQAASSPLTSVRARVAIPRALWGRSKKARLLLPHWPTLRQFAGSDRGNGWPPLY